MNPVYVDDGQSTFAGSGVSAGTTIMAQLNNEAGLIKRETIEHLALLIPALHTSKEVMMIIERDCDEMDRPGYDGEVDVRGA